MDTLEQVNTLLVQQKKEWGEILSGIETKNKYAISLPSGEQVYWAAEESSFLARWMLKNMRPFKLHILSKNGQPVLTCKSPFRFFLHEMVITDGQGKILGSIKQHFALFAKRFSVKDVNGTMLFTIYGPFFHPWTFQILHNNREVGKISKKWSGMGKEIFTDADNFNIAFPTDIDKEHKGVLLGALFLIDMLYFERSD